MSTSEESNDTDARVHREYIMNVRIVETGAEDGERYCFEAPEHGGRTFEDADTAELYADVYFDVNGFEEAGTGERGIPPVMLQAGRDTLAAYMLTMPYADRQWVGSFFGVKPGKIERYESRIRKRATNIRRRAKEEGYA